MNFLIVLWKIDNLPALRDNGVFAILAVHYPRPEK